MLKTRLKEHEKGANNNVKQQESISGLSQHIKESNHNINFDDVEVLYREMNFQKRKFKEAIAIKKHNNQLLNKKEEVKALSNIWENLI